MRLSLFAVAAFCVSSLAARADTVYNYVGQNFTFATVPYTTSDRVTGSFTVATPLAANLSNYSFSPESFTFSDGVQTLTQAQYETVGTFANFSTDANGNITQYGVLIFNQISQDLISLSNDSNGHADGAVGDVGSAASSAAGSFSQQATVMPAAVTPEPSSILLLGSGMLGVVGMLRKRFV